MKPIRALIWCPKCGRQHIDEGEWATREHHKHRCVGIDGCGHEWSPLEVPTVGIRRLNSLQVRFVSGDQSVEADMGKPVPPGFEIKPGYIIAERE